MWAAGLSCEINENNNEHTNLMPHISTNYSSQEWCIQYKGVQHLISTDLLVLISMQRLEKVGSRCQQAVSPPHPT